MLEDLPVSHARQIIEDNEIPPFPTGSRLAWRNWLAEVKARLLASRVDGKIVSYLECVAVMLRLLDRDPKSKHCRRESKFQ